jgi:ribosome-binding protein aMBF1 (putative translation factor)
MPNDEGLSGAGRRSGTDRRSGMDTRSEEERRLTAERRSNNKRRSGLDRRATNEEAKSLRKECGQWLKQLREARGLSQRRMANVLDLEYYTVISQVENGYGRIPSQQYADWAKVLGIAPRAFVRNLIRYYEPRTYEILFALDG